MFRNLHSLYPYLWKNRRRYLAGFTVLTFNNAIWILFPLILGDAVNDLNTGIWRHRLSTYVGALLAIALFKGVFQFGMRWILIGISRDIEFDLRNDLFRHLESLSHSWYQRTRTGDIMARATNDLNAVRMLLGPAIMYSANTLVFTAGALIFMMRISPRLTFWGFLPLPLASLLVQYFGRRIHDRFERIQAMFSDISSHAQENFSAARLIRAYVQEEAEIASFEHANQEYIRRSLLLIRLMGMLWPTLELLLGLAIVIVLWVGGREVVQGHIDVGRFVAFNTFMVQLTFPMIALGWVVNLFQRGTASMGRLAEVLAEKPSITDEAAIPALAETGMAGTIEFRNLNFSFSDSPVLWDINLTIPSGTSLAIVGPTGSGKSTLVNLIPRIYDAEYGSVLLDGRPIQQYPLDMLRRNIGFVPQETFLFSETIRENIAFGVENATIPQIEEAAQAASIAQDIEGFPKKYDTLVGERGITLSGGQKQRTAIARALIRQPRILVLDDALSSVDTYTEERILEHLRRIMRGRTTIFISHRVSTVQHADQIAVMQGGRIVEIGTHEELLTLNGYYTELHSKQLLEEELESV